MGDASHPRQMGLLHLPRSDWIVLLTCVLTIRAPFWIWARSAPFTNDEHGYWSIAQSFLETGEFDISWPPITSALLAAISSCGGSLHDARLIWTFIDAANIGLLYTLLSRFLERPAPLIASLLYTIYVPAISFASFATSEMPAMLLFLASACLMIDPRRSIGFGRILVGAIMIGLLVLTRSSLAVLAVWIAFMASPASVGAGKKPSRALSVCVALVLGAGVVGLWVTRNYLAHGEFIIAENVAYNLYLGNQPHYSEDLNLFHPFPTQEQIQDRKELLKEEVVRDREFLSDHEMRSRAVAFIAENPFLFARRALGRLARVFAPKTAQLQALGSERDNPWFTAPSLALLISANLLYGLALFGGWAGIILCGPSDREKKFRLIALGVLVGTSALCTVAIAKPRYSFPSDPILIAGLAWLLVNTRQAALRVNKKTVAAIMGGWVFLAWSWAAWLIWSFMTRAAVYAGNVG
ncbi:MAG: hypothetical protein FJ118_04820 [Deltaproteobacteria bacterium]|nr:hypothetical protein [Deltaproteobacteria bacterium]